MQIEHYKKVTFASLIAMLLILTLLMAMLPLATAHSPGGDKMNAALGSTPIIDGNWTAGEWDDAQEYEVTGPGGTSYLRIKHNSTHLHILIDSPWDTTNATVFGAENTWVAIDTSHDGVSPPQPDDYLFHIGGMNAWRGNTTHWDWMMVPAGFAAMQSGSWWGPGVQPSPKSAIPHRIDEMEIPLGYVGSPGATVGFYVMVTNDTNQWTNYVEWPPAAGGNPMAWPVGMWYMDPCPAASAWGDLKLTISAEMDAPFSPITPTIDGFWGGGEWSGAAEYIITGPGGQSYLRIKHNGTHLHILIDSPWDTTNVTGMWPFENTWVAIDTSHDGVSPPQPDDYLFHIGGMNAWRGNTTHWDWMMVPAGFAGMQSSSTAWGPGVQPSPKSAIPHRIDEMEIPLGYVGSPGATVGFYVLVVDDSAMWNNYVEWPPAAGGNPMGWPAGAWYADPCPPSNAWGDLKLAAPPVGGTWIPVDKLALLTPYIGLTLTIIVAIAVTATFLKYRKKQ